MTFASWSRQKHVIHDNSSPYKRGNSGLACYGLQNSCSCGIFDAGIRALTRRSAYQAQPGLRLRKGENYLNKVLHRIDSCNLVKQSEKTIWCTQPDD